MSYKRFGHGYILTLVVCFLSACTQQPKVTQSATGKPADTLFIWADTSLRVIVNEQKKAFENGITSPVLSITYLNEKQIIDGLMSNKVSCAILHRQLLESESKFLQAKEEYLPKQYNFAYDAFVCVTSRQNPNNVLSMSDLQNYFVNKGSAKFQLALDNTFSQSIQFLKTRFALSNTQLSSVYAKNNLEDLFNYLRTNPQAVGLIPFSYISDIEAASTIKQLENLKVLPLSYVDSTGKTKLVQPSQETITTKEYPLIAPIVLVNCNMEKKSGTNFVNYLFKPRAQRLILKCGLCPAIFPGREVHINTN